METHPLGAFVLCPETLLHLARPDAAGGAELGDFLEKVVVAVEEEGKSRRKLIDVQPPVLAPAHVFEPVRQRERELLDGCRTGLTDVVSRNADSVPAGHFAGTELDRVDDQPHGRFGRKDVLLLGDELFEDVVLKRARQIPAGDPALLRRCDVHRPDDGRRRVDRHGCGDRAERQTIEQGLHICERGNRNTALTELSISFGCVGVVPVESRQVERYRQAGVSLREEITKARVCLFGASEAGEHAGGP